MSLYYLLWLMLIVASLWASLGAFLWAHHRGQFKDQDRARFLPLRGETGPALPEKGPAARREACVMLALLATGAGAIVMVLIMVISRTPGAAP